MESVVCELARFIVVFHGFDDVLGAVDCGAGLAGGIEAARTRMHADIEDLSRAGGQTREVERGNIDALLDVMLDPDS